MTELDLLREMEKLKRLDQSSSHIQQGLYECQRELLLERFGRRRFTYFAGEYITMADIRGLVRRITAEDSNIYSREPDIMVSFSYSLPPHYFSSENPDCHKVLAYQQWITDLDEFHAWYKEHSGHGGKYKVKYEHIFEDSQMDDSERLLLVIKKIAVNTSLACEIEAENIHHPNHRLLRITQEGHPSPPRLERWSDGAEIIGLVDKVCRLYFG